MEDYYIDLLLLQCIGIPIEADLTPFWGNLYLYDCKVDFISDQIKTDKPKDIIFKKTSR